MVSHSGEQLTIIDGINSVLIQIQIPCFSITKHSLECCYAIQSILQKYMYQFHSQVLP